MVTVAILPNAGVTPFPFPDSYSKENNLNRVILWKRNWNILINNGIAWHMLTNTLWKASHLSFMTFMQLAFMAFISSLICFLHYPHRPSCPSPFAFLLPSFIPHTPFSPSPSPLWEDGWMVGDPSFLPVCWPSGSSPLSASPPPPPHFAALCLCLTPGLRRGSAHFAWKKAEQASSTRFGRVCLRHARDRLLLLFRPMSFYYSLVFGTVVLRTLPALQLTFSSHIP